MTIALSALALSNSAASRFGYRGYFYFSYLMAADDPGVT